MTKYIVILIVLVVTTSMYPVYAAQLDAEIPKNSEEFVPTFQFTRIVTIQFDKDSELAELVGDMQQMITFDINSDNASVLVDLINSELQEKSFVKVTGISGKYTAIITPKKESVGIEYKIVLYPTMQGHFIGNSETLDSQWRGFSISGEIPIETKFGSYDINSPKSVLVEIIPQTINYLSGSDAMKILDMSLIDASGISELSLSNWESLFDPTSLMSEPATYGFSGNVITNYSMGICTIFREICQDKYFEEEFVINGEQYLIRSIESQDDATIVIEGYVNESYLGKVEIFTVSDNKPIVKESEQVSEIYVMAGLGVVLTAAFFVWSDRKVKKTATEQTGIDPKDLRAVSIDDAGSYQTNRGTAYLAKR